MMKIRATLTKPESSIRDFNDVLLTGAIDRGIYFMTPANQIFSTEAEYFEWFEELIEVSGKKL